MVHGAFGFGDEWTPVVTELRAHKNIAFAALAWRGPWHRPIEPARTLLALVQSVLDGAPAETTQVLILAHSAGGLISSWAVRHARVPKGRHLSLAKIASPPINPSLSYTVETSVDTPLGLAIGGTRESIPPVPDGVEIAEYITADHPGHVVTLRLEGHPVFMGKDAGHSRVVARVAVPLIRAASDGAPPLLAHID